MTSKLSLMTFWNDILIIISVQTYQLIMYFTELWWTMARFINNIFWGRVDQVFQNSPRRYLSSSRLKPNIFIFQIPFSQWIAQLWNKLFFWFFRGRFDLHVRKISALTVTLFMFFAKISYFLHHWRVNIIFLAKYLQFYTSKNGNNNIWLKNEKNPAIYFFKKILILFQWIAPWWFPRFPLHSGLVWWVLPFFAIVCAIHLFPLSIIIFPLFHCYSPLYFHYPLFYFPFWSQWFHCSIVVPLFLYIT